MRVRSVLPLVVLTCIATPSAHADPPPGGGANPWLNRPVTVR